MNNQICDVIKREFILKHIHKCNCKRKPKKRNILRKQRIWKIGTLQREIFPAFLFSADRFSVDSEIFLPVGNIKCR